VEALAAQKSYFRFFSPLGTIPCYLWIAAPKTSLRPAWQRAFSIIGSLAQNFSIRPPATSSVPQMPAVCWTVRGAEPLLGRSLPNALLPDPPIPAAPSACHTLNAKPSRSLKPRAPELVPPPRPTSAADRQAARVRAPRPLQTSANLSQTVGNIGRRSGHRWSSLPPLSERTRRQQLQQVKSRGLAEGTLYFRAEPLLESAPFGNIGVPPVDTAGIWFIPAKFCSSDMVVVIVVCRRGFKRRNAMDAEDFWVCLL
jgi:hypothetical protein